MPREPRSISERIKALKEELTGRALSEAQRVEFVRRAQALQDTINEQAAKHYSSRQDNLNRSNTVQEGDKTTTLWARAHSLAQNAASVGAARAYDDWRAAMFEIFTLADSLHKAMEHSRQQWWLDLDKKRWLDKKISSGKFIEYKELLKSLLVPSNQAKTSISSLEYNITMNNTGVVTIDLPQLNPQEVQAYNQSVSKLREILRDWLTERGYILADDGRVFKIPPGTPVPPGTPLPPGLEPLKTAEFQELIKHPIDGFDNYLRGFADDGPPFDRVTSPKS